MNCVSGSSSDSPNDENDSDDDDSTDAVCSRGAEAAGEAKVDPLYDPSVDEKNNDYVYNRFTSGGILNASGPRGSPPSPSVGITGGPAGQAAGISGISGINHGSTSSSTDAVLSCPCCFNVVCSESQKHDRYENQYRAMFVNNVYVEWLANVESEGGTNFYQVCCDKCGYVVARLDGNEEIYHFFDCVATT